MGERGGEGGRCCAPREMGDKRCDIMGQTVLP